MSRYLNKLPLFVLRHVLFPGGRMLLKVIEPRYYELIRRCYQRDGVFGTVLINPGTGQTLSRQTEKHLMPVGTLARIVRWQVEHYPLLSLLVEGVGKFRIESTATDTYGLLTAEATELSADSLGDRIDFDGASNVLAQLITHRYFKQLAISPDLQDPGQVSCLLSQYLPLSERDKYQLLVESNIDGRLKALESHMEKLSREEED